MENKKKRLSILKVRQHVDLLDEATEVKAPGATTPTMNRRVSFHNMKQVRQYDRDHGKMIEESPLREKITDTMDSDGVLTPRGRTDAGNSTINVFGNVNKIDQLANGTMNMSLETVNVNDDTLKMFSGLRDRTISESTMMTEGVVLQKQNMTIREVRDMSIVDESEIFAVPQMPKPNATINKSVFMDLDESQSHHGQASSQNDTMALFLDATNNANISMDISIGSARQNVTKTFDDDDMEITQMDEKTLIRKEVDETVDMFESPARNHIAKKESDDVDMEITLVQMTPKSSTSKKEEDVNETVGLFKSPARNQQQVFKEVEEENNDMDITQPQMTPKNKSIQQINTVSPFDSPKIIEPNKSSEDVDMEITLPHNQMTPKLTTRQRTGEINETFDMFKSPAPKQIDTSKFLQNDENVDMEITQEPANVTSDSRSEKSSYDVVETNSEESLAILEKSHSLVEVAEQDRAMGNCSVMNISDVQETLNLQNNSPKLHGFADISQESMNRSTTSMSSHKLPQDDTDSSPQKTMQIESTTTLHEISERIEEVIEEKVENVEIEIEVEVEVEQKTFQTENYDVTVTESTTKKQIHALFNHSLNGSQNRTHSARRRRSLLRSSVLESPRRIALENSMVSTSVARERTALEEYRRRKSLQTSQQSILDSSNLHDVSASARDIFALNMSVRSPHQPDTPKSKIAQEVVSPAPQFVPFQMANFDPAVTNIVWLTPDEDSATSIPEALEFSNILAAEKTAVGDEIQKALEYGQIDEVKWEAVRNDLMPQMSQDEKEAVLIAREEAEIRFLQLRLRFATEHHQNYELKVNEIQTENKTISDKVMDLQNIDSLSAAINEFERREVVREKEKIVAEWREAKQMSWDRVSKKMNAAMKLLLEINQQREADRKELEEIEEKIARLDDASKKERAEIMDTISRIKMAAQAGINVS
uniref:Uncharacterized protein n=1 Tax=Caenorhabditis japonica TaxID=281687 RepID=A0A8R1E2C0_CAEJA